MHRLTRTTSILGEASRRSQWQPTSSRRCNYWCGLPNGIRCDNRPVQGIFRRIGKMTILIKRCIHDLLAAFGHMSLEEVADTVPGRVKHIAKSIHPH
ncbi:hypothetical protein VC858_18810 [Citrobacter freundii]|nr:hypothetical protein [Citrobacter freundii]